MKITLAVVLVLFVIGQVYARIDEQFVPGDSLELANHPFSVKDSLPYALVAGGSKGIGYAIAEALASRQYNLILIARGYDSLVAAKSKLEALYPIHVEILSYDLSKEESAREIAGWCTARNIKLKILCNVAGLGGEKDYLALPLDSLRYMVNLNLESCMAMSLLLLPGPVFTKPSIKETTKKSLGWFGMQMAVPPKKAVKKTLKKKMIIVPGTLSNISSTVIRILPNRWAAAIYSGLGD